MDVLYQPGDVIQDKYRIVGILGEGGTAITYEAVDFSQENLTVAIKVLSLQQVKDWKLVELFEREVRVLKSLNHPKIPQYLDYFTIDTTRDRAFFLVQELIPGKSLATLIEQGWRFQESEVKDIAQQILEILTYLHNFKPPVIHRDIKPHNIIRTDEGKIYLVDLGAVQDAYRNTLTRGATFVGTIDYMSPEQLRGHASFASDLYSLGCTLLYLLTRRSPSELPLQRMKINFRSSLNISEQFAEWLDTILEPALEDRFSSTQEALEKLNNNCEQSNRYLLPVAGSRVEIDKSHNQLEITIPKSKVRLYGLFLNILTLIIVNILAFLFILNNEEPLSWQFFLIIHSSISIIGILYLAPDVLSSSLVFTTILFSNQDFYIEHKLLMFKRKVSGKVKNISKVSLERDLYQLGKSKKITFKEYCAIEEGVKQHRFARWLTKIEKQQLAIEIHNYLLENCYKK